MSSVENILHRGELICMLIRSGALPERGSFFTPRELQIQVGRTVRAAASAVQRHQHLPVSRTLIGAPEVLVVEKGRMILTLYAMDRTLLGRYELAAGDIAVLCAGGHGMEFTEDTSLLEVKQGPYQGDCEKECF